MLAGKELSFNNLADADAALECVMGLRQHAGLRHRQARQSCGVALGETPLLTIERAYACDPTSAFGGIIAFNRPLDAGMARSILERQFVGW